MGKKARKGGMCRSVLPSISFKSWQQGLCADWFACNTAFTEHIIHREVVMESRSKARLTPKSIAIFVRFGVAMRPAKSPKCKGPVKLEIQDRGGDKTRIL